ncbi:hypothetical protein CHINAEXTREME_01955 [Halobiforma lacisalsi AJ5]|uniref:DUF4239 domain-containing protein n=1 Tax=Natronobacterium lacisalsi AJ5 TaxID=358396 RepID=M0LI63_NATLA|nr:hypothetical protein [Halobiforma lacisalsi]APW96608.1 hypothetical protein CHINAEXTREME_01955 [Halobiforma lacisalsi AJ5]EMA32109.1 hypothetical protein C445_12381 [Halobiforma lacisalsi AJ5]
MSGDGSQPGDTMARRSESPTWVHWLLLNANRWLVTGLLVVFVFVGLLVVARLSPVSLRALIGTGDPVETLFQALSTALITGVTLVVTINSLVLSQELGAVEDQRKRLEGALDFREDIERAIDAPISPPEPSSFVRAIIAASDKRATDFREAVSDSRDEELIDRVDDFVDNLTAHADSIRDDLEDAQFGTYEVLKAALDYNYSWKIFRARRIKNAHADSFTDEAEAAYDELLESLKLFGLAREHFKTLYFQWELINLSRAMMYVAVPALVVTMSMLLFFDADVVTGTVLGVDVLVWIVAAAATVAVTPFLLLIAFLLRIATMAKRTLAIGPFILRESSRGEEIDWE